MDSLLDYDQELLAPPWGSLGRDAVLGAVATVTKLLLNVLNTTRAINHETYLDLVMHRPPGVGLLTVSNHTR
jgi:monolysocardiolipin acyltransferase